MVLFHLPFLFAIKVLSQNLEIFQGVFFFRDKVINSLNKHTHKIKKVINNFTRYILLSKGK